LVLVLVLVLKVVLKVVLLVGQTTLPSSSNG
jgi:hypothetical protein